MDTSSQEPSFLSYLAREPVNCTWQTDILGHWYVLFLPFVVAGLGLYLDGNNYGDAQRDKFELLLNLQYERTPVRGELKSLTKGLPGPVRERLDSYRSGYGKEPASFLARFIKTELKNDGSSLRMPAESLEKAAKLKTALEDGVWSSVYG